MIAILIMGVGLLAMALLQTMNVRFTKSSQQRTVATTLAYEVIDMMRLQSGDGGLIDYGKIAFSDFSSVTPGNCARGTTAGIAENIARWKCEVRTALPDGAAQVSLSNTGLVTVTIKWGDVTWARGSESAETQFSITSQI